MPRALSSLHRSKAAHRLEINVAASSNEQLRHGRMPFLGREMEGRVPKLPLLKVDVTARCEKQLRDGSMP